MQATEEKEKEEVQEIASRNEEEVQEVADRGEEEIQVTAEGKERNSVSVQVALKIL